MISHVQVFLVGSDAYMRNVIAHELREAGMRVVIAADATDIGRLLESTSDETSRNVVIFGAPFDKLSGISVARSLLDSLPGSRIGFLIRDPEFLVVSGAADGFAVLDLTLSTRALLSAIEAMAHGKALIVTPEVRQQHIDAVLRKIAAAQSLEAIKEAFKSRYENVLNDPLPAELLRRLDQLK